MEHVGLILGIEKSRLARNNRDCHNFLEMCAILGAVLADADGVYDPQDSNDRFLLDLKGTIRKPKLVTVRKGGFTSRHEVVRPIRFYELFSAGLNRVMR
ncbi:MAG: recombinase family protein [Isosphaeraceae bacterium]